MKLWSERISSLSCCRQLFVQEDAVPPVPYPKQARPGPMSNKKSSASFPLSGIPPAVCHGKLPLLGARHIQRCVETDKTLNRCNLRTLLRFVLLCEGNHLRYPRFYVLVTVRIPVREPDRSANSSSVAHISTCRLAAGLLHTLTF